jgi:hypothetical protein
MATALIQERETISGNQMRMTRLNEDAAQTFLQGTPVMINTATGGLKVWDGITITIGIAGIAKEVGANLSTVGIPLGPGGGIAFGSVQNEPLGVNLSRPVFNDGKTGIVLAIPDTVFYGQIGPAQSLLATDISKQYGMTKDSDNHWFVDKTKTGASAVLTIVGFDTVDTLRGVLFSFLPAVSQIPA